MTARQFNSVLAFALALLGLWQVSRGEVGWATIDIVLSVISLIVAGL